MPVSVTTDKPDEETKHEGGENPESWTDMRLLKCESRPGMPSWDSRRQ